MHLSVTLNNVSRRVINQYIQQFKGNNFNVSNEFHLQIIFTSKSHILCPKSIRLNFVNKQHLCLIDSVIRQNFVIEIIQNNELVYVYTQILQVNWGEQKIDVYIVSGLSVKILRSH